MKNPFPTLRTITAFGATIGFLTTGFSQDEEKKPVLTLIQNVKIFDGHSEKLAAGSVLIENHLIKKIGTDLKAPEGATVIDGKGGTLMPGLIDMHSHLVIHEGMLDGRDNLDQMAIGAIAVEKMRDYLDQGFTTARDAGGNTLGLAKAVREGRIPGPRIYPSGGFMSQVGGHADTGRWNDNIGDTDMLEKHEFGYIVSGRAQMLEAARHNLRAGATQIKIMGGGGVASEFDPLHMTQFTLDEMKAAVEVAEDYGTYCLVHAYHDRSVNRAIDAGVKCIEHNFLVSEETIIRMKEENIVLSVQGVISLEAFADPDSITFFSADQKAKAKKVNSGASQMLKWALEHDIMMVTGGDMFDKANANRQVVNMIVLKTVGYPDAKILEMGTGDAAKVIAMCGDMNPYKDGPIGVIEEGAYADILVVNGDPTKELEVLKDRDNLQFIMKNGDVWKNTLVPATHPEHTPATGRHTPGL
ncbi:MAG: amidohydrolase family protein [Verrucomicrobiales bacterium]